MPDYRRGFKRSSLIRSAGMIALYALILLAIFVVGRILEPKQEPAPTFGSLEGRFRSDVSLDYQGDTIYYRENEITNYLIIGIDRSEMSPAEYQAGGQADFLLVLSIDRRNRTVTPVMIDRDTMAQVPTYGVFGNPAGTREMQICLAHAFSGSGVTGSQNTMKAVSALLDGVKLHRFVLLDMGGISRLNDAVGGVTVTVKDDLTALDPALQKGATVRLNGEQAEKFVRGRTTVADGTNASRMTRQHTYLEALLQVMRRQMQADSTFVEKVFESLDGHMESDTPEQVLISDVNAYHSYQWQDLRLLPGTHKLGEDGFAEFWPDVQAMTELIVEIWFEH